jgi:hypothetical protein
MERILYYLPDEESNSENDPEKNQQFDFFFGSNE